MLLEKELFAWEGVSTENQYKIYLSAVAANTEVEMFENTCGELAYVGSCKACKLRPGVDWLQLNNNKLQAFYL